VGSAVAAGRRPPAAGRRPPPLGVHRLRGGDYPSRPSDLDWYQKWYESKNHARLAASATAGRT